MTPETARLLAATGLMQEHMAANPAATDAQCAGWAVDSLRMLEAILEAAAPEPSGKMPERVEPNEAEWQTATQKFNLFPTTQCEFVQMVSREAYRLAAERGKG